MKSYDCVIVGGGMVGAASALSLAELGLKVAVVERALPQAFEPGQPFDLRVSAISLSSQYLLEQVGAWQQISQWRLCPYKRLGVWEQELSYAEFNSDDIGQSHLGAIIENRLIQLALLDQVKNHDNICLYCPDSLTSFVQYEQGVDIELSQETVKAKLLIAADGANSRVRQLAGIGTTGWDYQQSAMLINVNTGLEQQDITWQQFFPTGPVAMLPMPGQHASLVWYHHRDEIKRLKTLSLKQLEQAVMASFPKRLGQVEVLDRASFDLTRRHANQYQKQRVVLMGDAAHSINPMAGQGVNLGFKDVKALQKVIAEAIGNGECWHDPAVLARYEKLRRHDNLLMMSAMDALYASFSHPSLLMKGLRNAGLFIANRAPVLKNKALAYACGL
ncbi:FAD-dependent oxidoreductase [Thalassomonas actiniarum]|uniref:FAD-dependent monooxygenase n=1 Tax=Thalassomonas actiniarum TaxID=485447 RepID=A0AAE9YLQ9_9GAMM|nr:FAD-dependent oxidoreductase [Thalassomonas actiniarum]WDD97729.1 FAD-dependent monooxygenase [Thalassomonas actiniarum]